MRPQLTNAQCKALAAGAPKTVKAVVHKVNLWRSSHTGTPTSVKGQNRPSRMMAGSKCKENKCAELCCVSIVCCAPLHACQTIHINATLVQG
eukprot:4280418-Amphidinium_carterae.3